jgi:peptide/nickel transport system substrate-binding protein
VNVGGGIHPNGPMQFPVGLVYDSLIGLEVGEPIDFIPSLAVDWEFNEDFTSLAMELREGVLFTDGSELDAELIARNIEMMEWDNLSGIAGVEVTGPLTFEFSLNERTAPDRILKSIALSPIVGAAGLDDLDALATTSVGSSAYIYDAERSIAESSLVFVPNPDYWNTEQFVWDEFVLNLYTDQVALLNALKSGQIDAGGPLEPAYAAEAEASGLVVDQTDAAFNGLYIADRTGRVVPALANVQVRQAMNMAFDRETIVQTLQNGIGKPTNQAWGPVWPAYHEELEDVYPYDPEAARELLAEAGYPDGFDLELPSFGSPYEPLIQQSLADIGIRVKYTTLTATDYFAKGSAGELAAFINLGPFGGLLYELPLGGMIPTGSYWNVHNGADPTIDGLMEAYDYGDDAESDEAASKIGEYILEQAWFVPFTTSPALWVHAPGFDIPGHPVATTQTPDWLRIVPAD